MGKARAKKGKKGSKGAKGAKQRVTEPSGHEDAIERAHEAMGRFEYSAACELLQHALRMQPDDCETLDMLGDVLLTYVGDEEKGRAALQHSIAIAPDQGHMKYFSLGQMLGGREGLELYQRGLGNVERSLSVHPQGSEEWEDARLSGVQAFCAVAELWQTDLCMEQGAENMCEEAVHAALRLAPEDVEAHYILAQLRLRQVRMDECKAALQQACQLLTSCDDEDRVPSFEVRTELAKLLMQVDEWPVAYDVLRSLLVEDDRNGFVWYLLCECSRKMERPRRALRHLRRAQEIAQKLIASGAEADSSSAEGGPVEFLQKAGELEAQIQADLARCGQVAAAEEEFVTDSEDEAQRHAELEGVLGQDDDEMA
eukprot:Hpha_TRINITY_DN15458_c0_g1::TRINITY_DN15458_c0_g1_i1::g.173414::m.173414